MHARIHFDDVTASTKRNMNDSVSLKDLFYLFLISNLDQRCISKKEECSSR